MCFHHFYHQRDEVAELRSQVIMLTKRLNASLKEKNKRAETVETLYDQVACYMTDVKQLQDTLDRERNELLVAATPPSPKKQKRDDDDEGEDVMVKLTQLV